MIIEERNPTIDEYNTLRQAVGWKLTEETSTRQALENTLYSVVAMENNKIIGIGRVIGDDGLYYYVQDLLVEPDYQNQGLGKKLMSRLMDYINVNANPGSIISLMSAPGLEDFYKAFGFSSDPKFGTGMYIIID